MKLSIQFTGSPSATMLSIPDNEMRSVIRQALVIPEFAKMLKEELANINVSEKLEEKHQDTLVCSECGSTKVQRQAWVDANTHEYKDDTDPDGDDEGDNWCEECEEHTPLCLMSEFEEMIDDWARKTGLTWIEDTTYEKKRETYNRYKNAKK